MTDEAYAILVRIRMFAANLGMVEPEIQELAKILDEAGLFAEFVTPFIRLDNDTKPGIAAFGAAEYVREYMLIYLDLDSEQFPTPLSVRNEAVRVAKERAKA